VKYAVEIGSGAMMYIPSFIKTHLGIQNFIGGNTPTHRQHRDSIAYFLLFKAKKLG
jgi:hypothetical protein